MKLLLQFILKILARATLRKYRPYVIGVTGSVGKTSTRQAIAAIIATTYSVWQSPKNLNNEIGLPLAILGEADSGYRNVWRWLKIFVRGIRNLIIHRSDYPSHLVLEYGVDHPGDMDYLLSIARPRTAILTAISPAHLEFMGTVETLLAEKGKLLIGLPRDGCAIINADDNLAMGLKRKIATSVRTYGFAVDAEVRAEALTISYNKHSEAQGISFKLMTGGSSVPITIKGTVGRPAVLVALAATAVGQTLNIPLVKINQVLSTIPLPAGRLRLLGGIKHTTLIDDTYNSSPRALDEAMAALAQFSLGYGAKKWAVLGDMLELGKDSKTYHFQAGETIARSNIDYLVTIGALARQFIHGAAAYGFNHNQAWHFDNVESASYFIKDRLGSGDVVLLKASQGIRCEKITKELLAEPQRAGELLVRQYKPWI